MYHSQDARKHLESFLEEAFHGKEMLYVTQCNIKSLTIQWFSSIKLNQLVSRWRLLRGHEFKFGRVLLGQEYMLYSRGHSQNVRNLLEGFLEDIFQ